MRTFDWAIVMVSRRKMRKNLAKKARLKVISFGASHALFTSSFSLEGRNADDVILVRSCAVLSL